MRACGVGIPEFDASRRVEERAAMQSSRDKIECANRSGEGGGEPAMQPWMI